MKRPNVLLIMTDQQRGDCLGIDGHPVLRTPSMDRIAGEGVRFTCAYSSCPTCIAARRSLLSGRFPSSHGMVGYQDGVVWDPAHTLPGVLSKQGYQTSWVGRSIHQYPERKRYGFDHMVIQSLGANDYEEWLNREVPGSGGYYGTGVMHNDWTARPWHLAEQYHPTNWTVERALEFLRKRDPSCPFFLAVSFIAPHPPLVPPAPYFERYLRMDLPEPVVGDWATPPPNGGLGMGPCPVQVDLKGSALREARAAYYGLISHVDDQINRLLNPVTGVDTLTDNPTIVIFTSDHGEMLGDHYLWRKSYPYESSARIPLLMRVPQGLGVEPGRMVSDRVVCLEDIMPTVLSLCGAPVPSSVEGRSLLPLMQGRRTTWRPWLHIEHAPLHHTLTDGREKYIWFAGDGREQLFRLVDDPQELHNLSANPEEKACLAQWRKRLIAELRGRPERFTDGKRLIAGRPYPAVMGKRD